jgi:toxin ParE1/3/4
MPCFRVTPRAREDLQNIGRYTERHWSRAQRNLYLKNLERRFAWLADNPRLGKHRSDVHHGYYSFPQGEHVVFDLIGPDGINVIGIPHKEMDIIPYFLSN